MIDTNHKMLKINTHYSYNMFFYHQEHSNEILLTMLIEETLHVLEKAEYVFENNNKSTKSKIHGNNILLLQEWVILLIV